MAKYKNKRNEKQKPSEEEIKEAIWACHGIMTAMAKYLRLRGYTQNRNGIRDLIDIYNLEDERDAAECERTESLLKTDLFEMAREGDMSAMTLISKTRGHKVGWMHGETEQMIKSKYSQKDEGIEGETLEQRLNRIKDD